MDDTIKPERIIDRLYLKPENIHEVEREIRCTTTWFNWELTKLQGAQI